jgi:hypothetical protein
LDVDVGPDTDKLRFKDHSDAASKLTRPRPQR